MMMELSFEKISEIMKDCKKRLDENDLDFNWNSVELGEKDSLIEKIKHRLSNELYLKDNDVYRILLVLIEEVHKFDEELF